jgi:hypothetical protein
MQMLGTQQAGNRLAGVAPIGGVAVAPTALAPRPAPAPLAPNQRMSGVNPIGGVQFGPGATNSARGAVDTPGRGANAGPAPAGPQSQSDVLRAEYEKHFQDLLASNQTARGQMQDIGQANIAALQRRNGALAGLSGRGVGGGYLGGQRTALMQGMNTMNQGLMQNDAQRMDILGRRMGDRLADARASEAQQFQLDLREADATAEAQKNATIQSAADWAGKIKTQTGIDVNDPASFKGPYAGEIQAAYQRVQAGDSGAQAELAELLRKRQLQYEADQSANHKAKTNSYNSYKSEQDAQLL